MDKSASAVVTSPRLPSPLVSVTPPSHLDVVPPLCAGFSSKRSDFLAFHRPSGLITYERGGACEPRLAAEITVSYRVCDGSCDERRMCQSEEPTPGRTIVAEVVRRAQLFAAMCHNRLMFSRLCTSHRGDMTSPLGRDRTDAG